MKLYHYSKNEFDSIKTLEQQEKDGDREVTIVDGVKQDYKKHISFFFEKAPLDILGKIFGKEHSAWYPGSELFEYCVDSSMLGKFSFHLVESPEKTKLYYDSSLTDKQYCQKLLQVERERGYIGRGEKYMEEAITPLLGGTREAFKQLPQRPNWKEIKNKYAATVPHLMVYPDSGIVRYESKHKVTVR